jgi:hypothetical protein
MLHEPAILYRRCDKDAFHIAAEYVQQPQPVNSLTSDTGAHVVLEHVNQEPDNVIRRPAGFEIA